MVDDRLGHDKCPLCQLPAVSHFDTVLYRHGDRSANNHVKCDRCGEFDLTWGALERIDELGVDYLLSGITREWTETGKKDGKISEDNVNTLINLAPRTLKDRRRRLLKAISRKAAGFESEVMIDCNRDHPFAFVRAKNDFVFILGLLQAEGSGNWGFNKNDIIGVTITAQGWDLVDEMPRPTMSSEKAFVAMWLNDEVNAAYSEGIEPAIKSTGYNPIRIDFKEYAESVIDEIIAEIKESRFVVADFTEHRNGVYFEAGYGKGLGLDVIWTCRHDHMTKLHFDIRGFNVIVWNDPADLRQKLSRRIRAVVGYGPLHDPTKTLGS